VILAQKPIEGTFAHNALTWGCGGLNIDGCRIPIEGNDQCRGGAKSVKGKVVYPFGGYDGTQKENTTGRFPANVIVDEEVAQQLDQQTGKLSAGCFPHTQQTHNESSYSVAKGKIAPARRMDSGGASRFFYCAKASRSEREAGLAGLPTTDLYTEANPQPNRDKVTQHKVANNHPTVKPLMLCRYLATLILPPPRDAPRRILVPYSGSGSEVLAALQAGWEEATGIEKEKDYIAIARGRIEHTL
jgi:site-specific DNA-methyltransferase (adenine-specific)